MANQFFTNNNANEQKLITRLETIENDALIAVVGTQFTIKTNSRAPRIRLKFWLDAVERGTETDLKTYRIGKYYEIEHLDQIQLVNSAGYFSFFFECISANNGNYNLKFTSIAGTPPVTKLYISSLVVVDSFYNDNMGWLNPDNAANIRNIIVDETVDPQIAYNYIPNTTATSPAVITFAPYHWKGKPVRAYTYQQNINFNATILSQPVVLNCHQITNIDEMVNVRLFALKGNPKSYVNGLLNLTINPPTGQFNIPLSSVDGHAPIDLTVSNKPQIMVTRRNQTDATNFLVTLIAEYTEV
jgi:hypothetical protein